MNSMMLDHFKADEITPAINLTEIQNISSDPKFIAFLVH